MKKYGKLWKIIYFNYAIVYLIVLFCNKKIRILEYMILRPIEVNQLCRTNQITSLFPKID